MNNPQPPLRVLFAGTPDFSLPPFQMLIDEDVDIVAVLTQPDRRAGRGKQLRASPVKQLALDNDLDVLQPESLRDAEWQRKLAVLKPELMIVVAYGLMIPDQLLELPRLGCWNIHASLLPRWRGAAPIQRAIEAGDNRHWIQDPCTIVFPRPSARKILPEACMTVWPKWVPRL